MILHLIVPSTNRLIVARAVVAGGMALALGGCFLIHGDFPLCPLRITGALQDLETGEPLNDVTVLIRTITAGSDTGGGSTVDENGNTVPLPGPVGPFDILATETENKRCPPNKYVPPDELEFTVLRDGCEVVFRVPVNAETVVDTDTSDGVLEFREPISVPPCEE